MDSDWELACEHFLWIVFNSSPLQADWIELRSAARVLMRLYGRG